jgi:hypothetical protein
LVVNDGEQDSATATVAVTILGTITDEIMFVHDIDMALIRKRTRVKATAKLTVHDDSGAAVSGATVTAHWSGAYSTNVTLLTDGNGEASHTTKYVNRPSKDYTFTIDNVLKSGYFFDEDQGTVTESISP